MFKSTVLRQARLCRLPAASLSIRASSRPILLLEQIWLGRSIVAGPSSSQVLTSRRYSSAPAETLSKEKDQTPPSVATRFADLASLGVHENLVASITRGMGYDNMTEVQSLTINPALAGKDLFVAPLTFNGDHWLTSVESHKPKQELARR